MRHSVLQLLASGLLATLTPDALAQPVPVVIPLLGQGTNQGDAFGWHAIINDGVAIVTAPGVERGDGTNGTIYAFRDTGTGPMGGWAQEAAFRGSRRAGIQALAYVPALGGAAGGAFVAGGAPAQTGPNPPPVPVPSPFPSEGWGGVYVFRRAALTTGGAGGWVEEAFLRPAIIGDRSYAGSAVALAPLSGSALALAMLSDANAVVFERSPAGTWAETATLPRGVSVTFTSTTFSPDSLKAAPSTAGAFAVTYSNVTAPGLTVFRRSPAGWARQATLRPATPPTRVSGFAVLGAGETRGGVPAGSDFVLAGYVGGSHADPTTDTAVHLFRADAAGAWTDEGVLPVALPPYGGVTALDLDAAGRVLAYVISPEPRLRVFRREAAGVWTEVASVDRSAQASIGRTRGAWGGRAVVGNPVFASNGTNSGGAWVVDLRPVLPVAGEAAPAGASLSLSSPSPNPSHGAARLTLTVAEAGAVRVSVVDVLGREVAVVLDRAVAAGELTIAVETGAWPAGVYVVRATAGAQTAMARLVVAR